jgi:TolA-binding protein
MRGALVGVLVALSGAPDGAPSGGADDRASSEVRSLPGDGTATAGAEVVVLPPRFADGGTLRPPGARAAADPQRAGIAAGEALRAAAAAMAEVNADGSTAAAVRCAAGYAAVYNDHPELDARGDELLRDAARCADLCDPAAARTLRQALRERYPRSPLAPQATLALAERARTTADYATAAALYAEFAGRSPDARARADALRAAVELRAGLEQPAAARELLGRLVRALATTDPEQAAAAQMAGWRLARDDRERLALARAYLREHGRHGGADRLAVAEAEVGRLLWERACRRAGADGLCASELPGERRGSDGREDMSRGTGPRAGAATAVLRGAQVCAAGLAWRREVQRRAPRAVAEARAHLERAVALGRGAAAPDDPARAQALRGALARAQLLLADAGLEALMSVPAPTGLDLSVRDAARRQDSLRRFTAFHGELTRRARALERDYQAVLELRAGDPSIAAVGRAGAVAAALRGQLLTMPLPRGLRTPALAAAYCAEFDEQTAPMQAQAIAAWEGCRERAAIAGELAAARGCEAALRATAPARVPPLAEIVAAPGPVAWTPEDVGLVAEAPAE